MQELGDKAVKAEADFNNGVWLGVEYLIIERDQPLFAKELCENAGITYRDAVEITERTDYEKSRLMKALKSEGLK